MIVSEFELGRYCDGNPLQVLDLGSGLNVAVVFEQQGKRQLLDAIPSAFFGEGKWFASAKRSAVNKGLPDPLWLGLGDVRLTVRTENGVFHIRRGDPTRGDDMGASVEITSADGTEHGKEILSKLLDGVDRDTFRRVFSLDTTALIKLSQADRDALATRLNHLARFLEEQDPRRQGQVPPGPLKHVHTLKNSIAELGQLVTERSASHQKIEPPSIPLPDRRKLAHRLRKLDTSIAQLTAQEEVVAHRLGQTQCAITINRAKGRMTDISHQLNKLRRPTEKLESTTTEELILSFEQKTQDSRHQIRDLQDQEKELRHQLDEIDRTFQSRASMPKMEALLLQEKSLLYEEAAIEQLADHIKDLEAKRETAEQRQQERASSLAEEASRRTQALSDLDRVIGLLRDAKKEYKKSQHQLEIVQQREQFAQELASSHPEIAPSADIAGLAKAEQKVHELRNRRAASENLAILESQRADLGRDAKAVYQRQMMPFGSTLLLGIPFTVGVGMILAGLLLNGPERNWNLVLLGMIASMATSLIKISRDGMMGEEIHAVRQRMAELTDQIGYARATLGHSDTLSADGTLSLNRQLELAERELETLQRRFQKEQERRTVVDSSHPVGSSELAAAQERVRATRDRYREIIGQWRKMLVGLNLAADLSPSDARFQLAQSVHDASRLDEFADYNIDFQLQQLRGDLQRRRSMLAETSGQLRHIIHDLGHALGGATIREQMDIVREAQTDSREKEEQRQNLIKEIKQIRSRRAKLKSEARKLVLQKQRAQDQARVLAEQRKVSQQLNADRIKLLERERDRLEADVQETYARYGEPTTEHEVWSQWTDEQLEAQHEQLLEQQQRLRGELTQQNDRRGRTDELMKVASRMGDFRMPKMPWDDLTERTNSLIQNWQTFAQELKVRQQVMDAVSQTTGTTRYLELAGRFLHQISGEYYTGIDYDPATEQLTVIGGGNVRQSLEEVEPYVLAWLYLCCSLARVEAYADRGVHVPFVMEDPLGLVNASHQEIMAGVLRDFSANGHQLLIVTSDANHAAHYAKSEVPIADFAHRQPVNMADETNPAAVSDATSFYGRPV